jgi:hypothetical protein
VSARRIVHRVLLALRRACVEFVDDRGHRDAAQIAFFAALSFVPLSIFAYGVSLVLVFGAEYASGWSRLPDDDEIRSSLRERFRYWDWVRPHRSSDKTPLRRGRVHSEADPPSPS